MRSHMLWIVWFGLSVIMACDVSLERFHRSDAAPADVLSDASDDAPVDAPLPMCAPTACAAAGGACNATDGHCRIQTAGSSGVACPPGHFCDITCSGPSGCRYDLVDCGSAVGCTVVCGSGGTNDQACDRGVRCPATGPCTVTCNGGYACRNGGVTCGAGPCDVSCLGDSACGDSGVDCSGSMTCHAQCVGAQACERAGVICGPGSCDVVCNGDYACRFQSCTVLPTQCAFHCCGSLACGSGSLCSTCTRDAVCL
jgi:hypothetical protein